MKTIFNLIITALISVSLLSGCQDSNKYRALIVTGQGEQNWQESHKILQKILENSGIFKVEISLSPAKGKDMSIYSPDFKSFDLVVLDYNGDEWPEKTKKSFVDYVKKGGGVLVYNESVDAFPDWDEYNMIIGLGGKGRDEKSGPYVFINNKDKTETDTGEGAAGLKTKKHDFLIEVRDTVNPVLKGMPERWLHPQDIIYSKLRGQAGNMTILATAFSAKNKSVQGSGRHEPVMMSLTYENGRVFSTVLGFVGDKGPYLAMQDAGLILALQRGAEWAATGHVTQKYPDDMPNIAAPFILPNYKFYTLDELFMNAENYEFGKTEKFLYLISNRIRNAKGDKAKLAVFEDKILEVLGSDEATNECKNYLCRDLSCIGTEKSIPVLEKLKENEETADMANFALARIKK